MTRRSATRSREQEIDGSSGRHLIRRGEYGKRGGSRVVNVGGCRRPVMAWYAKFDGIDGSAQHKDHKAWCNASNVNMRGNKAGGGGTGVGRVGGKMHLDDISLGIMTDKALPKLLEAAVKGQVFKTVEIQGTATYGS